MDYTDLVWIGGAMCLVWWGAIKSLLERKRSINDRSSLGTPASGYMNRPSELPPNIIDCEWELLCETRGLRTHHWINLMVFALVAIYYLSDWIAAFVVWAFL